MPVSLLSACNDSLRDPRSVPTPRGACQQRILKHAHMQVTSVDKCEKWDSGIPTTCKTPKTDLRAAVPGGVHSGKMMLTLLSQRSQELKKDVVCDMTPYSLVKLYHRIKKNPAASTVRSTLIIAATGMFLPNTTVSRPVKKIIFIVTTVRTFRRFKLGTAGYMPRPSFPPGLYHQNDTLSTWSSSVRCFPHPSVTFSSHIQIFPSAPFSQTPSN